MLVRFRRVNPDEPIDIEADHVFQVDGIVVDPADPEDFERSTLLITGGRIEHVHGSQDEVRERLQRAKGGTLPSWLRWLKLFK